MRLVDTLTVNEQIVVGIGNFALDFLLAVLESHQARRLFEDKTAVFGLGVHNLFYLTLPDNRVPLFTQTYAVKERDEVAQTAGLVVQEVLTFKLVLTRAL